MASLSVAAQNKYRFSVGGGFHSMMFWGLRDFKDVEAPQGADVNRVYQNERYNLDYKNFVGSTDYSFGISVNWFNKEGWILSQRISCYLGQLTDEINLELIDIGDGSTTVYYPIPEFNSSNVGVGTMANVRYQSEIFGGLTSLVLLRKINPRNIAVGGGVYYTVYQSMDRWWNGKDAILSEGYHATYMERGKGVYTSSHIGISLNATWNWKFIQCYVNVGNSIFTTKKEENKGKWYGDFTFFPTSHNFDYRFPLSFETGIALSLDKIKK
jgi:hypothetical protein